MYEGKNDYDTLILCLIALRSGGRRLAVRTAMEHHIGALPRTPFPASRDFPSRGNEKIGGTGYCVTYDTDSQSRNADFISIAQRAIHNPRPEGPSNLRTFRPSGRSILRTLTPQACYPRRNVLLLPIYSGWCFLWQQRWPLHFLIIRIRWSISLLPACGRSTLRTMMSRIRS